MQASLLSNFELLTHADRAVLAVGPDRGWEEPAELALFDAAGFDLVTLGERTLRTDVALTALVAMVHDRLS